MMNGGMLDRLQQWWQSLKQSQKVILILGCAFVLLTLVFLVQLTLRPAYVPLFTELEPQDAGKIIEELESANTPYRLADGGRIIEVPEDLVYKLRIQMASAGVLYSSGVGFELFDEKKFGVTEFEQHVGYQRALQEELRRTIVQLEEVEQSRVHLVLPRESVFLDEQVTPSASIALKLKPNKELQPNQVRGIQSLVMGSVQGLAPENIHIIDMEGHVLNDSLDLQNEEQLSASALERYELKRKFEKELETRIQQMLNRILGPGRAVAMISADLDFDQQETVRTEHGPGAILSEQTLNEQGTEQTAGGAFGNDSEGLGMPGGTMPNLDGGTGSDFSREERITNYEVDTTQQVTVRAPGSVRNLSVSVVVDGVLNQDNLDNIQQVVASAVGYDAARGDQLTVSGMEFNAASIPSFEEPSVAETPTALPLNYLTIAGLAAGGLFLLLLIIILLRRRARRRYEKMLAEQEEEEEARRRLEQELEEEKRLEIEEPKPGYRTLIKQLAKEKPAEVVEVLKVWLRE